jgi:hypothetical protein
MAPVLLAAAFAAAVPPRVNAPAAVASATGVDVPERASAPVAVVAALALGVPARLSVPVAVAAVPPPLECGLGQASLFVQAVVPVHTSCGVYGRPLRVMLPVAPPGTTGAVTVPPRVSPPPVVLASVKSSGCVTTLVVGGIGRGAVNCPVAIELVPLDPVP